jgi:hypothetical protein
MGCLAVLLPTRAELRAGPFEAPGTGAPALAEFHPLTPGFRWTYRVEEKGRRYRQEVRLQAGANDGSVVLLASSPRRRSRYQLRARGDSLLLVRAEVRLPYLPFGRSRSFDPPLPLLALGPSAPVSWDWRGSCGTPSEAADMLAWTAAIVGQADSIAAAGSLRVCSEGRFMGRSFTCQQVYERGVGLVFMETGGYRKVLEEYRTSQAAPRRWLPHHPTAAGGSIRGAAKRLSTQEGG